MSVDDPLAAAVPIAERVMAVRDRWPSYTDDLLLEGLLGLYDATGERRYLDGVLEVWAFRGRPRDSLTIGNAYFTCLHMETYRRTGDPRFLEGLVETAAEWRRTAPRVSDGAVAHRAGVVLLDMLAGYAPLQAAAAAITGNHEIFRECEAQCLHFRNALRDPASGLWHHARGWSDGLSPSGWCRGQAWVLRALVKSLSWGKLGGFDTSALRDLLTEFVGDLLRHQGGDGMWHQLADEEDSYPEASGTGLILAALRQAGRDVGIDTSGVIRAGVDALGQFISDNATVENGCVGTPPLPTREAYRHLPCCPNDPHAVAAAILAFASVDW